MKILALGPSASGKSYPSQAFRDMGIHAFDADELEGLAGWYDGKGAKAPGPPSRKILERCNTPFYGASVS